ncbi:hypothetical protein M9458_044872, partial [Cirrhinus mrigala]
INGNLTVEHIEYFWDGYNCTDVQCTDRENGLRDRLQVNLDGSLTITNITGYWSAAEMAAVQGYTLLLFV